MPPIGRSSENNNKLHDQHFGVFISKPPSLDINGSVIVCLLRACTPIHTVIDRVEEKYRAWVANNKIANNFFRKCRHSNDIVCALSWQSTLPQAFRCSHSSTQLCAVHSKRVNTSSSLIPFSLTLSHPIALRHCRGSCLTLIACCIQQIVSCDAASTAHFICFSFRLHSGTNIVHRITLTLIEWIEKSITQPSNMAYDSKCSKSAVNLRLNGRAANMTTAIRCGNELWD